MSKEASARPARSTELNTMKCQHEGLTMDDNANIVIDADGAATDDGWEWAIVEIMGHRKHFGRIREVEQFGAKMMRVDVPTDGDPATKGWTTHFYTGASIFSLTYTT